MCLPFAAVTIELLTAYRYTINNFSLYGFVNFKYLFHETVPLKRRRRKQKESVLRIRGEMFYPGSENLFVPSTDLKYFSSRIPDPQHWKEEASWE
jgi:hypothetical protein